MIVSHSQLNRHCPVEPLAREAVTLMRGIERLRQAGEGCQPEGTEYSTAFALKALLRRLESLEAMASHLAASSSLGVLFQLCVARNHAAISNEFEDGPSHGHSHREQAEIRQHEDAAWRLLSSAFEYHARTVGEVADVFRHHYTMDGMDFVDAIYSLANAV